MRWDCLWMAGALLLSGCARNQPEFSVPSGTAAPGSKPNSSAVIVTPGPANLGRITAVNTTSRFVVITYPAGVPLPAIERRLDVYRGGLKVAEIKITGPSRDLNTVGDITAGECQAGDEVRGD